MTTTSTWCTSHFRNNVKEHLKDVDAESKSTIINQVFGQNDGDGVYKEGLLDADSAELLQTLSFYESVRDGWREISHSFVSWFDSKIPTIKVDACKCQKGGRLGFPTSKVLHP